MINFFVCQICGEPYIGGSAPDDCPFCGAPKNFIKSADEYTTLWGIEITEEEKGFIQKTLELEVNATAYYLDVAKNNKKYGKYERLYKQFARVEKEHAEVAAKLLGADLPEFTGEKTKGDIKADLERTRELETHAMGLYKDFLAKATTQKVKWFFMALKHAEDGHREYAEHELQ